MDAIAGQQRMQRPHGPHDAVVRQHGTGEKGNHAMAQRREHRQQKEPHAALHRNPRQPGRPAAGIAEKRHEQGGPESQPPTTARM
ncbi:MAG: hypothetical protein M5R42_10975 [Rhodocyclaceae bacterium]|nr:hypothetical protein [Rhodocyclaceae bacterium]